MKYPQEGDLVFYQVPGLIRHLAVGQVVASETKSAAVVDVQTGDGVIIIAPKYLKPFKESSIGLPWDKI